MVLSCLPDCFLSLLLCHGRFTGFCSDRVGITAVDFLCIHGSVIIDTIRINSCFFQLLITLFHFLFAFLYVGTDDIVHIHLINMPVDNNLLNRTDNCTGNPVDTHTTGECQTEECGHNRHKVIHYLHGILHGSCLIVGVIACLLGLGHQLYTNPLG